MRLFFASLLMIQWASISFGQNRAAANGAALAAAVKAQASKMGAAFISGDYATFASYTYPALLQAAGGAGKISEALTQTVNGMRAKGMAFGGISFGEPTAAVRSGSELQCTIAQHTTISLSPGRVVATSTLIAISGDNGKSWTFIDTAGKDMAALRKMLPNLSPYITIPPPQPPVRYNS